MFPEENRERQRKLSDCLYDISKKMMKEGDEYIVEIRKLSKIYENGFKHSYDAFFPVVTTVLKGGEGYDVQNLKENLEGIRKILEDDFSSGKNEFESIYPQFIKLCEHITLLVSEVEYITITENKVNDAKAEIKQAKGALDKANEDLLAAGASLEEVRLSAKSLQTELIAVLSIFSAIVITFSGSFTFLGSVMSSISGVSYYEMVVLAAILCGLFIFNTIFLMMYFVAKITNRNIYARCPDSDCSCNNDKCKCECDLKCNGIKKIRKRLPYVFYFNVMCLIGILIDCFVWFIDIKGGF